MTSWKWGNRKRIAAGIGRRPPDNAQMDADSCPIGPMALSEYMLTYGVGALYCFMVAFLDFFLVAA